MKEKAKYQAPNVEIVKFDGVNMICVSTNSDAADPASPVLSKRIDIWTEEDEYSEEY